MPSAPSVNKKKRQIVMIVFVFFFTYFHNNLGVNGDNGHLTNVNLPTVTLRNFTWRQKHS